MDKSYFEVRQGVAMFHVECVGRNGHSFVFRSSHCEMVNTKIAIIKAVVMFEITLRNSVAMIKDLDIMRHTYVEALGLHVKMVKSLKKANSVKNRVKSFKN